MKLKALLTAAALTVAPTLGMAMCSGHTEQAMSCADGMVWDSESRTCVSSVTG